MKKGTKLGLGAVAFLAGAIVLTGCTNSFCSKEDKGHIMYAFDYGVSVYHDASEKDELIDKGLIVYELDGNSNVVFTASFEDCPFLKDTIAAAQKDTSIATPSLNYYIEFDKKVLAIAAKAENIEFANLTIDDINGVYEVDANNNKTKVIKEHGILDKHGDLKFYVKNTDKEKDVLWTPWNEINNQIRMEIVDGGTLTIDDCPTTDFIKYYQNALESKTATYRSCLSVKDGYFGHYGQDAEHRSEAKISGKDWGYAWGVGPLSGLLVYPIGWSIDSLTNAMIGVGNGVAQLLAILIVTVVVRGLMLAVTFKQTTANTKMQTLQPELAKIQAKYPNANTNQYEKQRLAEETSRLYKKNGINPLSSILIMFIQFPIFICVWGAMQGSAMLSTGSFLGLHLSDSISSVLTTWSNWGDPSSGVWTALVLFLLMSASQVVSMLLPQWIQKRKMKKVQKLGRNPAKKAQDNKMKWFTYIMMIFIIIMGFSLASAMGVYWFVGALISIAQTLITNAVSERKKNKERNKKVVNR